MPTSISRTDLARNTREIVDQVRQGQPVVVQSYGEEQIVLLTDGARNYLDEAGFLPIKGSPELSTDKPCVYIQGNAYPYAFAMRADFVQQGGISPSTVIALPVLDRKPDIITLQVESTPKGSVIVAVDELAFPGWQGRIDGEPAPVESIGGLIGVILPPGFGTHTVVFQFRPPLFVYSAWLTLLTIAFIVLYLLRAERLVRC